MADQDSNNDDSTERAPEVPNQSIENDSGMVSSEEIKKDTTSEDITSEEIRKETTSEDTNKPLGNSNSMASFEEIKKEDIPNNINISLDSDSGMASLQDSSKDVTPEKPNKTIVNEESDDEDIEDETIGERLWGLTEMFPESVVNGTCVLVSGTKSGIKGLYNLTRNVMWIFFSSSVILVAPLIIEVERAQMLESQRSQEKQILLGSNAAMSSNLGPNMAMIPTR